ncbi:MAG: hypothetical protein NZ534_11745, partial [Bacteroidia bacterium]|nr:hypothetical protein [Bacteroidia bacterium]
MSLENEASADQIAATEALHTTDEERKRADELRKNKRWPEAAEAFEKLWQEKEQSWDGFFWAQALRNAGDGTGALNAARAVFAKHRDFKPVRNLYALCIYDLEIKELQQIRNEERLFKALEAVKELCEAPEKPGEFNLLNVAVWKAVKIYKERVNFPAEAVLRLMNLLDPQAQETTCYETQDESGKKIELASKLEEYYMLKTKALLQLKRYQECIECCNEALNKLQKFHYDNDVWFKMRIAQSNAELGEIPTAIQQLESLLGKRREWFIQRNLADWYLKTGDVPKALKYILDAALNHGDLDKKIGVYKSAVEILAQSQREDDARKIVEFIAAIHNEYGKKYDAETAALLEKYGVSQDHKADVNKEFRLL